MNEYYLKGYLYKEAVVDPNAEAKNFLDTQEKNKLFKSQQGRALSDYLKQPGTESAIKYFVGGGKGLLPWEREKKLQFMKDRLDYYKKQRWSTKELWNQGMDYFRKQGWISGPYASNKAKQKTLEKTIKEYNKYNPYVNLATGIAVPLLAYALYRGVGGLLGGSSQAPRRNYYQPYYPMRPNYQPYR